MPKYQNLEKNIYKKKLLDIAKVYNVIDIKKKLLISKLTIKQIETLLKKNNVSLPKNDSKNNLNPIVWENILKVSLIGLLNHHQLQ